MRRVSFMLSTTTPTLSFPLRDLNDVPLFRYRMEVRILRKGGRLSSEKPARQTRTDTQMTTSLPKIEMDPNYRRSYRG